MEICELKDFFEIEENDYGLYLRFKKCKNKKIFKTDLCKVNPLILIDKNKSDELIGIEIIPF